MGICRQLQGKLVVLEYCGRLLRKNHSIDHAPRIGFQILGTHLLRPGVEIAGKFAKARLQRPILIAISFERRRKHRERRSECQCL